MANVGDSGESEQTKLVNVGEFSESDQFFKKTILASTRIRQKLQISGKYLNSLNSTASSHCLIKMQNNIFWVGIKVSTLDINLDSCDDKKELG